MTVLAFDDTGGGATALVLVHGFTLDRHLWDDVALALAADIRVVCPDLRGFGDSPPPIEAEPYTHADDLVALLDERGIDDVVIVGLSMGGWVALEFALTYPARVRGLVLVSAMVRAHPFPYGWNKNIGAVYRRGREHGRDAAIALWLGDEAFAFERSRSDLPDFHAMATTLSTNIAGAVHHVMPDAGHLVPLASPDEFVALLRAFVRQLDAPC